MRGQARSVSADMREPVAARCAIGPGHGPLLPLVQGGHSSAPPRQAGATLKCRSRCHQSSSLGETTTMHNAGATTTTHSCLSPRLPHTAAAGTGCRGQKTSWFGRSGSGTWSHVRPIPEARPVWSWRAEDATDASRRTKKSPSAGSGVLRARPPISTSHKLLLASFLVLVGLLAPAECGNPDAKRLYDDLLSNYNKLVRPVVNVTDVLTVRIKLKLSQLIDVNLKNQIMTTNLWVEQYWFDYKLIWEPEEYGGAKMLHVPSDHIWRPDIVLYNNADGNFEVTLSTKATLHMNGLVEWKPPAIYKSSCEIDVEYFPFDEQTCVMKFGSWTYDGFQVDLRHLDEIEGTNVVDIGVDLSEFYRSVEWDILEVPAVRHEKFYTCCDEPYLDITFNITMRRKTLFYTVNLIIPCMGISFLTVLTFYLPSDSGEKVTLSISILISLHVFFLLVVEIIPPTSLVVPLLGKYLIFAMILVSISICVTVLVLNVHFRSPQTHKMAPWVRRVFIHILPRLLIMKRPQYQLKHSSSLKSEFKSLLTPGGTTKPNSVFLEPNRVMISTCNGNEMQDSFYRPQFDDGLYKNNENPNLPYDTPLHRRPNDFSPMTDGPFSTTCRIHGSTNIHEDAYTLEDADKSPTFRPFQHNLPHCSPEVHRTCWCVNFIAEHTRLKEDSTKVKEDWKYVAMVLDRLFLWIFTLAVLVGTAGIILQAPSLYDDRVPLDKLLSDVYRQQRLNV
ncbi:acetylcholine receptor subunit alpha-like isoform X1 [Portunus trituberculatus]|uniref:acetylcholine receptor subunit alpha-like isoform X1 n=1 Tax=Portunus trituberculatus TaxID=210409 RepID=UPI001E1CDD55|nr:acetylcholine receptor subunit alpha-like isoform X1 [Portunus trituberculatus]